MQTFTHVSQQHSQKKACISTDAFEKNVSQQMAKMHERKIKQHIPDAILADEMILEKSTGVKSFQFRLFCRVRPLILQP